MRWLLILGFGCDGSAEQQVEPPPPSVPVPVPVATPPPETFADFFGLFRHKTCAIATGECADVASILRCADPAWRPPCVDFDAEAGVLCLERPAVCASDGQIVSDRICDVVCLDAGIAQLGAFRSEACQKMLACDVDLAQAAPSYSQVFQGESDPAYGIGGTCFEGDVRACEEACGIATEGLAQAAAGLVTTGELDHVPGVCL